MDKTAAEAFITGRPCYRRMRFPLLLALVLVAAGCVAPNDGTDDAEPGAPIGDASWPEDIIVFGEGHDHRDWSQHVNMSTPNFQSLGYDPLATEFYGGKSAGGYFCGGNATSADGREIAVISSLDSDVAFVIVDVTDPAKPTKLGEYVIEGTIHYDVDVTDDGKYVVIGSDADIFGALTDLPGVDGLLADLDVAPKARPIWRDACTGEEHVAGPEEQVPLAPATLLIDISDPTTPTFVDAFPAPVFGPHSVSTATIDGTYYVTASITNLAQPVDYFQFFQIDELPTGAKLAHLSTWDGSMSNQGTASGGHVDAELAKHPVTGQMVAYLSNWDGGLVILDMNDPRVPSLLSYWLDAQPEGGQVHSTKSIDGLWGDKHYIIAGQEFVARPVDRPSGWVWIIDDTDPANPIEVGRWTLPLDTEAEWAEGEVCCLETWSTHYFDIVDRTLYVAMYHGGIWAVDLTDPAEPRSIGAFVPDRAPPDPRREPTGFYDLTPFVLDVFPRPDHTLTVFDGYSGVYTVKFDPTRPMAAPTPWPTSGGTHDG